MLILSSPSGAGKTTLVKQLSKNKDFHISVSHTTRKPRRNEIQDEDYHFINNDEFKDLIKPGEIQLTFIFLLPDSSARLLDIPIMPAFDAA